MKQKGLCVLLGCEAAACLALYSLCKLLSAEFSALIAFPLEQLGSLLRWMSLSGGAGNLGAIALYALLSLLPLAWLAAMARRRRLNWEALLLPVLSGYLFFALYLMVNPGLIPRWLGEAGGLGGGRLLLGGCFYVLLIGYAVLRGLRRFRSAEARDLYRFMDFLLVLLCGIFVFAAFGMCFGNLLAEITGLRAANQGMEAQLTASYGMLVLEYIVTALPYVLDVLVAFAARRLLAELRADAWSQASVDAANRLSSLCVKNLSITVWANVGFHLILLLFARRLNVVHTNVRIPILSILFALAALLLARFIRESRQVKTENDLFI